MLSLVQFDDFTKNGVEIEQHAKTMIDNLVVTEETEDQPHATVEMDAKIEPFSSLMQ